MNKVLNLLLSGLHVFALLALTANLTAQQQVAPEPSGVGVLSWGPEGTEVAIAADNGLFIYDSYFQLLRYRPERAFSAIWSPDGRKLLVGNQIVDVLTLNTLLDLPGTPRGWIGNGSEYFRLSDGGIGIFDALSGTLIRTIPTTLQIETMEISPDGRKIAVQGAAAVFDVEFGNVTVLRQGEEIGTSVAWSPDSTQIAYISYNRVRRNTLGSTNVPNADFATLTVMKIINAMNGEVLHTSPPLSTSVYIAWSRDNSLIVGVSTQGDNDMLFTWDANSAALLSAVPLETQANGGIDFSPFSGRVVIGLSSSSETSALASVDANILPGGFQIVVPDPSPERLQAIAAACDAPPQVVQAITSAAAASDAQAPDAMSALVDTVDALPADTIPPACAADLLAVAEAIAAQGE